MEKLQQKLSYTFNNQGLLTKALTHRSFSKENNERLEFLGDSILGMVISEALFLAFEAIDEGKLTRMKSSLVRSLTLVEIAKELELFKFLILSPSEKKSGGLSRDSILEDAMEAIFGAIYLDSNFEVAKSVILNLYDSRLKNTNPEQSLKDDKTILQEYLQKFQKQLPVYELVRTKGKDHNAVFLVQCTLPDYNISITKEAKSIKHAQHACAKTLLSQIKNE